MKKQFLKEPIFPHEFMDNACPKVAEAKKWSEHFEKELTDEEAKDFAECNFRSAGCGLECTSCNLFYPGVHQYYPMLKKYYKDLEAYEKRNGGE